ncbi:MAG: uracil-DNA glycosylase family protein [Pseudomonadota bacterium]
MQDLLAEVKACRLCESELEHGVRPVLQASMSSTILVAGQAPGSKVHASGVPFDDASGDRLREWMGVSKETFYDARKVAILPMGFCYPGTGKSGDLPPVPRCADTWRSRLLEAMPNIKFTLLIGQYALNWHLPKQHKNLTETVRNWASYGDAMMPLPHPSPRNNIWLKKNPWFLEQVIPELQERVRDSVN